MRTDIQLTDIQQKALDKLDEAADNKDIMLCNTGVDRLAVVPRYGIVSHIGHLYILKNHFLFECEGNMESFAFEEIEEILDAFEEAHDHVLSLMEDAAGF